MADPAADEVKGCLLVAADAANVGDLYDGNVISPAPIAAPAIDDAKAARRGEVEALFQQKLAAGFAYGARHIQLRDGDRANIGGMAQQAQLVLASMPGVAWPADFAWRCADDSNVALATASDGLQMALAAAGAYLALSRVRWGHKDAIKALDDVAAIAAYDIEAGW